MQEVRAVPPADCQNSRGPIGSESLLDCSASLDVALAEPHDKALFYSASVQFLRKRLQEKSIPVILVKKDTSYSCTDIRPGDEKPPRTSILKPEKVDLQIKPPELSMKQLLPFPKANREGLLLRLMNSFRRQRKYTVEDLTDPEEDNPDNFISRFKFPRCERLDKNFRCLVKFSDEKSETSDPKEIAGIQIKVPNDMLKVESDLAKPEDAKDESPLFAREVTSGKTQ